MSIFFALRGMASAPVDSLRVGGLAWFQDLTVPDPTYILPVLTCATLAAVMKVTYFNSYLNSFVANCC
jgi:YidC/Oxa1 family membrane protein insertase